MTPNIPHIKLWIAALRSGRYKQVRHKLRSAKRFCCLGVACDVYRKATKMGQWRVNTFVSGDSDANNAVTTIAVKNWFGIESHNPILTPSNTAAGLNDEGVSFAKIADLLEQNYVKKTRKLV